MLVWSRSRELPKVVQYFHLQYNNISQNNDMISQHIIFVHFVVIPIFHSFLGQLKCEGYFRKSPLLLDLPLKRQANISKILTMFQKQQTKEVLGDTFPQAHSYRVPPCIERGMKFPMRNVMLNSNYKITYNPTQISTLQCAVRSTIWLQEEETSTTTTTAFVQQQQQKYHLNVKTLQNEILIAHHIHIHTHTATSVNLSFLNVCCSLLLLLLLSFTALVDLCYETWHKRRKGKLIMEIHENQRFKTGAPPETVRASERESTRKFTRRLYFCFALTWEERDRLWISECKNLGA